ncbi:MAG: alpha/beta hydrolase [Deltaproteobacteria bacterium]|nr:alpha/beta hydrolase [Deltaproteobacteria bacterium]
MRNFDGSGIQGASVGEREPEAFQIMVQDQQPLAVWHWPVSPGVSPQGVVQIVHGMAEHAKRYQATAEALCAVGYAVVAHDQRGHGQTAAGQLQGHYADHGGWELIIKDLCAVRDRITSIYPSCPVFMLGHSMGSFIAQDYMELRGHDLAGVILSGSSYLHPKLAGLLRIFPWIESLRQGRRQKSPLVHYLSFASFNRHFRPNRSEFDWLSRDPDEVDLYIQDPMCGFRCSNQLWMDLMGALRHIFDPRRQKQIPPDLPVYIIGGTEDPVSSYSADLLKLVSSLKRAGMQQIHSRFFPGCRHELFHEINREEIMEDLIRWIRCQRGRG